MIKMLGKNNNEPHIPYGVKTLSCHSDGTIKYNPANGYDLVQTPKMVDEYMELCKVDGKEVLGDGGNAKVMKLVNLPTISGLSLYMGVSPTAIRYWCEEYPEMRERVERLMCMQEVKLVSGGLGGQYNPTIAKVILTKHGYVEKQEVSHGLMNDGTINAIDELYARTTGIGAGEKHKRIEGVGGEEAED